LAYFIVGSRFYALGQISVRNAIDMPTGFDETPHHHPCGDNTHGHDEYQPEHQPGADGGHRGPEPCLRCPVLPLTYTAAVPGKPFNRLLESHAAGYAEFIVGVIEGSIVASAQGIEHRAHAVIQVWLVGADDAGGQPAALVRLGAVPAELLIQPLNVLKPPL